MKSSKSWQLQEAKAKLSELVDTATQHGPQRITRRGKACAYVVSPEEFRRHWPQAHTLKLSEIFRPLKGLKIGRLADEPRSAPDFGR